MIHWTIFYCLWNIDYQSLSFVTLPLQQQKTIPLHIFKRHNYYIKGLCGKEIASLVYKVILYAFLGTSSDASPFFFVYSPTLSTKYRHPQVHLHPWQPRKTIKQTSFPSTNTSIPFTHWRRQDGSLSGVTGRKKNSQHLYTNCWQTTHSRQSELRELPMCLHTRIEREKIIRALKDDCSVVTFGRPVIFQSATFNL